MYDFKDQLEWLREQTELSGDDCWDIVCALRGPDIMNYMVGLNRPIKASTTQVIRNWLQFQVARGGPKDGMQETLLAWVLKDRGQFTFDEVSKQCSYHFASHIYEAEEAIQKVDSEFYIFKKELSDGTPFSKDIEENDDERSTD